MTLYLSQTLPDGATVIGDDANPNVEVVLKPGQWELIAGLPESEQRHRLRELLAMNQTGPDPRSEVDQQAMETAQNAASGEAHQEGERQ